MEKFIAAVEALHPGCEVVDVRFMLQNNASLNGSMVEIDAMLAEAVANSTSFEPSDLVNA